MSKHESATQNPDKGISMFAAEVATAIATLIFGLAAVYQSYIVGVSWGSDGPGSGYFPFRIGLIVVLASLYVLAKTVTTRNAASGNFVTYVELKRVASVFVPAAIYVAGIQLAGIYVASAVFMGLFMKLLGKYRWSKTLAVSICFPVATFVMFEIWFKVPLPKGPLEAALGF